VVDVRAHVRKTVVADAQRNLVQLAGDQATSADAILNMVESETNAAAAAAQLVLRRGSAAAGHRGYSRAERPPDPANAFVYDVAADVPPETVRAEVARFADLDEMFARIHAGDANLEAVYLGTRNGLMLTNPWDSEALDPVELVVGRSHERSLNAGVFSDELRAAFRQHGVALSRETRVSTATPQSMWLIRDASTNQAFTARRAGDSLEMHWEFDPRVRDWYLEAAKRGQAVWTKYASWGGGKLLFSLGDAGSHGLGDRVTSATVEAFARERVLLREGTPIAQELDGSWKLQDRNGKNYQIWNEHGVLTVYATDILTCSRAVLAPNGLVAGVVGLDINMTALGGRILHANAEALGDAFLLDERGELVEQERSDMIVPAAGGALRAAMTAGKTGIAFDTAAAAYVAYAPIASMHSPDGAAFWSLGISMPEGEVVRLADQVEDRMGLVLRVLVVLLVVMIPLVAFIAFHVAGGITRPIRELDAGARRLGTGDLEHRLDVTRSDEIGELSDTFNRMARDLQARIRELRETTAAK
ncbi:MAG: HAMP domain-containing protein, partial [bacterium]